MIVNRFHLSGPILRINANLTKKNVFNRTINQKTQSDAMSVNINVLMILLTNNRKMAPPNE